MKKSIFLIAFVMLGINLFSQVLLETNDVNKHFDASLFPNGIASIKVYTKVGCDRCVSIVNFLTAENVAFTQYDSDSTNIDTKIFNALPHKNLGYSVGYPVFELDTVLFFNIENHIQFANDLKAYLLNQ